MSIFAEILCNQFPDIAFPSINYISITRLNHTLNYTNTYYNTIRLIYHTYFMPYKKNYKNKFINKFDILDIVILSNKDISAIEKKYFLTKFTKAQSAYASFRKFAIQYKFKYYNQITVKVS